MKKNMNNRMVAKRKELLFCILMVLLPTIQFILFYIVTNVNSFFLAFKRHEYGMFEWDGIGRFVEVFNDLFKETINSNMVKEAMKNSFIVYFVGLLASLVFTLLFAYYIHKKYWGGKVFKVLLFLPNILSMLTLCFLFKFFVNRAVPEIFMDLWGKDIGIPMINGAPTEYGLLMFAFIFFGLGTQLILYLGAMSGISDSIIEASELDGVSSIQQLWYIVIPMIFPTIKTFLVCGLAGIFTNQFNLMNFYGLGRDNDVTIGYYFYRLTTEGKANYPYIAAFGLMISAVLIPVTLIINKLLEKAEKEFV